MDDGESVSATPRELDRTNLQDGLLALSIFNTNSALSNMSMAVAKLAATVPEIIRDDRDAVNRLLQEMNSSLERMNADIAESLAGIDTLIIRRTRDE